MRQHEPTTLPNGVVRCRYCGAAWSENMGITCVDRPGPEPVRAWHGSALDDIDAMHARLGELRKEREAAESASGD